MNNQIVKYLKEIIISKGIKYTFISKKTNIKYDRLLRIFNQGAIISGSELICLCNVLEIKYSELMKINNKSK